jgi:hypothetical protein
LHFLRRIAARGKRFVVRADEKLTAFIELDSAIRCGVEWQPLSVTGRRIEVALMAVRQSINEAANYEDDEADNQDKPAETCSCEACDQSTDYKKCTDNFPPPASPNYTHRSFVATLTFGCAARRSATVGAGSCLV